MREDAAGTIEEIRGVLARGLLPGAAGLQELAAKAEECDLTLQNWIEDARREARAERQAS